MPFNLFSDAFFSPQALHMYDPHYPDGPRGYQKISLGFLNCLILHEIQVVVSAILVFSGKKKRWRDEHEVAISWKGRKKWMKIED